MHAGAQRLMMAGPGAALLGGLGQSTQAPPPSAPTAGPTASEFCSKVLHALKIKVRRGKKETMFVYRKHLVQSPAV